MSCSQFLVIVCLPKMVLKNEIHVTAITCLVEKIKVERQQIQVNYSGKLQVTFLLLQSDALYTISTFKT